MLLFFFFKQKTAYEMIWWLEFRRVLFRSQLNWNSLFTGEIIGSKFIKSQSMLMTLCRQKVTKQGKMRSRFELKIVLLQYLRTMNFFPAETVTTRLQLQFQHSFLHDVSCHDAASWNWSKTEIIKISRSIAFKWGITCPNWATGTTKP